MVWNISIDIICDYNDVSVSISLLKLVFFKKNPHKLFVLFCLLGARRSVKKTNIPFPGPSKYDLYSFIYIESN